MAPATRTQVHDRHPSLNLDLLAHLPANVTLLELVYAISAICSNEQIVVNTVIRMLAQGRVRLCGNFRDSRIEDLIA